MRIAQLDEALTVIENMWSEDHPAFKGKYYTISDAVCEPKPLQKPRPPILIGGSGPKMMEVAAKHADIVNIEGDSAEIVESKLTNLEKACNKLGRDFGKVEKSWGKYLFLRRSESELREKERSLAEAPAGSILYGTPDRVIDEIQKFVDLGFTYFTFRFEDLPDLRGLQVFAEDIVPAFG